MPFIRPTLTSPSQAGSLATPSPPSSCRSSSPSPTSTLVLRGWPRGVTGRGAPSRFSMLLRWHVAPDVHSLTLFLREYRVDEALQGYKRAAATHGWTVRLFWLSELNLNNHLVGAGRLRENVALSGVDMLPDLDDWNIHNLPSYFLLTSIYPSCLTNSQTLTHSCHSCTILLQFNTSSPRARSPASDLNDMRR